MCQKLKLMKQINLLKKVMWFFSKGLRFRILLTLQALTYPNPLSDILEYIFQLGSSSEGFQNPCKGKIF